MAEKSIMDLWLDIKQSETDEERKEKIDKLKDEELTEVIKISQKEATEVVSEYSWETITDKKFVAFSLFNTKEEYLMEETMVKFAGFIYRMLHEYDENEYLTQFLQDKFADQPEILEKVNEALMDYNSKQEIETFLNKYLQFNPDIHVRSTYRKDNKEELTRSDLYVENQEQINQSDNNESDNNESDVPDLDKVMNLPADTFHRWKKYNDAHFEVLRDTTIILSDLVPDIDQQLIFYDLFDNEEQANKWKRKYQSKFRNTVLISQLGKPIFLGPFAENRKKIDYYNTKGTEVLKRIMEKREEDEKLGRDMMKKRVVNTKRQNIKEHGADPPELQNYINTISQLSGFDTLTTEQKEELRLAKESKRKLEQKMEDEKETEECPDDAIQVNVFEANAATGDIKKSKFYTKMETINETHDGDESERPTQ